MEAKQALVLKDISAGYRDNNGGLLLLDSVNLSAPQGDIIALIGRNGTGKSTVLRCMAGLQELLKGDILVDGTSVASIPKKEMARLVSYVSTQAVNISNLKVADLVGLGRAPYTNWLGTLTDQDRHMVDQSLEMVGMSTFASKAVDTLSDGERQRVMIARALAQDTPVILLDEPTAFLDIPNKYEILLLLRTLAHRHGKCILFSTHDLNIATRICDSLWLIDEGGILCGAPEEMMIDGRINKLFGASGLSFDGGNLSLPGRKNGRPVSIDAPAAIKPALKKFAERMGLNPSSSPDAGCILRTDGTQYILVEGEKEKAFGSLYELAKHLSV